MKLHLEYTTENFNPDLCRSMLDTVNTFIAVPNKFAPNACLHVKITDTTFSCEVCNETHHQVEPKQEPAPVVVPDNGVLTVGGSVSETTSTPKTKICKGCNHEFVPSRGNSKFCSVGCRKTYFSKRKYHKTISDSREAKSEVINDSLIKKHCEICDSIFTPDDPNDKYCEKCINSFGLSGCDQLAENQRRQAEFDKANRAPLNKVCPKCGHSFLAKDKDQFYCDKCIAKALGVPKLDRSKKK